MSESKLAHKAGPNSSIVLRIFRGDTSGGREQRFEVPSIEGMVVLDAVHYVQAHFANDLACRWNCKAARCGSCSAEINGRPRLMCKTRVDEFENKDIHVGPMRAFPLIKDLVTDVSWNYEVNKQIPGFTPAPSEPVPYKMLPEDTERVYEYRKCIECFLCQDVCHVLRNHDDKSAYYGPRYMVRIAALEMHPLDTRKRSGLLHGKAGIGMCNITKCCQEVCPEHSAAATAALEDARLSQATGPQRFSVRDVVRLKTRGRRLARVGSVLPDRRLEVWVLQMNGTVQHWDGPKVVRTSDVASNYGPLDDVGIGAKLVEQYITEDHEAQHNG